MQRKKYLASDSRVSNRTKKNGIKFPLHPEISHKLETQLGRSSEVVRM